MSQSLLCEQIKDLRGHKPRNWSKEVKRLCSTIKISGRDLKSLLDPSLICEDSLLAENINNAFNSVMQDYIPLSDSVRVDTAENDEPISVNEYVVAKASSCAGDPDDLPNWVLKAYADILAAPIADILNCPFYECKVPTALKLADAQGPFILKAQGQ